MSPWLQIGPLSVPVFYLVQSLNLCLVFLWTFRRASTSDLPPRLAMDLTFIFSIGGLFGGRLFHIIWEDPEYYRQNLWRVFDVSSGGFVYYGGFFFAIAAGFLFLLWNGEKQFARWFDFFAPILSLATAVGRIGCLFAGCCYGRVCQLPWAIVITDENGHRFPRHPAPLYSLIWEFGLLFILLGLEKNPGRKKGDLFATWALLHGLGRFVIEFIRDDFRGPGLWGLSISQFLSLGIILISIAWLRFKRPIR